MTKRNERISMELKKEISKILQSEIKDPRLTAMPGVIAVKVTEDMSYADVFVSLYGDEKSKAETLKAIESASGFIRRQLSQRLKLRYVPVLRFNCDDFIEQGFRINSILDSLNKERKE